ncbi:hypothetical protein AVEN_222223-1 [Araneus ventricosus]|uniref:OTU domain-containing protein n=1 Tax=Araneus ventricosus TaxID=182803 RepID=A0A4Y2JAX9_ARAVE|nr:hypothetical protein AVEN_222223-1 [Araneus ventricosus]
MAYILFKDDENYHQFVRIKVVTYIVDNWSRYQEFTPEQNVLEYRRSMIRPGTYGGELEISAFSELFGITIHVFRENERPVFTETPNSILIFFSAEI